ncbi:MAG: Maf family protein [Bacteroidota bacterium]
MIKTSSPIILASKSPRRKKLLKLLNIKFRTLEVHLDEDIPEQEDPADSVKRLSVEKLALAREKVKKGIIITADTIVVLDNHVLGKPADKKDAVRMLNLLSGRTHTVYTGFSIYNSQTGRTITDLQKTAVTFRTLGQHEIEEYVDGGSPMDKAGAYGIQDDFGAVFVEKISGCYYNVVGLPLSRLYRDLIKITNTDL